MKKGMDIYPILSITYEMKLVTIDMEKEAINRR